MMSSFEQALKQQFVGLTCRILRWPSLSSPLAVVDCSCSRFLKIQSDTTTLPTEPGDYSIIIIPGGAKGAATLSESAPVQSLLRKFEMQNKYIGTICAGSLAIKTARLIPNGNVTSHPSVEKEFGGYNYSQERVVVEGRTISSRG